MHLLFPKMELNRNLREGRPLFYVAGPIRGGGEWQRPAYDLLADAEPNCIIATPCRYDPADRLRLFQHPDAKHEAYTRQTDWEDVYMGRAALAEEQPTGCLLFWLPCESVEHPRPKEEGPYAQDTYGELGYWRAMIEMIDEPVRLVIGAERMFPGLHKLQRDLDRAEAASSPFPIYGTLEGTIKAAVDRARGMR